MAVLSFTQEACDDLVPVPTRLSLQLLAILQRWAKRPPISGAEKLSAPNAYLRRVSLGDDCFVISFLYPYGSQAKLLITGISIRIPYDATEIAEDTYDITDR